MNNFTEEEITSITNASKELGIIFPCPKCENTDMEIKKGIREYKESGPGWYIEIFKFICTNEKCRYMQTCDNISYK